MMSFGGNNRAQAFFKQHGWTDGGKIEAKYTSRAADLYRQLLTKEVNKSAKEDIVIPSSPVKSQSGNVSNGLAEIKTSEAPKDTPAPEITASPKVSYTAQTSTVKKPIGGGRKPGKTGGLGARKLTTKASESLYEQKPEEPVVQVSTSSNTAAAPSSAAAASYASRFEYVENVQSGETNSSGTHVIGHVAAPKSSNFFADFGMDSGPKKSGSYSSKPQVQESDEARKKFSNAKSISSAQYFGDQNKADSEAQVSLQKFSDSSAISSADLFGHNSDDASLDLSGSDLLNRMAFQAQEDISSLKNIAGETGKKLSMLASSLITDFQDRIL